MPKKTNYSFRQYEDESRKIEFQNSCPHTMWSTKCAICGKYLASDHHINFHTASYFKKDISVAIALIDSPELNFEAIEELKNISQGYDELIVLSNSIKIVSFYEKLLFVNKAELRTLQEEVAFLKKYRKEQIAKVTLLYPDTKDGEYRIQNVLF